MTEVKEGCVIVVRPLQLPPLLLPAPLSLRVNYRREEQNLGPTLLFS